MTGFDYDIAPDGQRFLILEHTDFLKPATMLTVVTDSFDELKRRIPR